MLHLVLLSIFIRFEEDSRQIVLMFTKCLHIKQKIVILYVLYVILILHLGKYAVNHE